MSNKIIRANKARLIRIEENYKMLRKLMPFLFVGILLSGCGYKEGDTFIVKENITGGKSIEAYQEAVEEANKDGTLDVGGDIQSVFKGDKVMFLEENKDKGFVLVQYLDGAYEDEQVWIPEEVFKYAVEK